jgi:tetratricopeptide (TPR) repeat protein
VAAEQKNPAAPHYRAFISYSHRDKAAAAWLHRTLETFRMPVNLVGRDTPIGKVPARLTPIFRDRDELPASGDLGQELKAALERAMFLIVICSPSAAQSHWVNEEILTFRRLHGDGRVLALVVDGEPNAPQARAESECFPPALLQPITTDDDRHCARIEPIAADLRRQADGRRLAKLKLIAALTGLGLDELARREAQRRARRLTFLAAASIVGMVFAIGLALYANARRIEATEQRQIAEMEAATARTVSTFLVDTFTLADPANENPRTITAMTILDRGAERIERELASQPDVQARLTTTIARAYNNLGLHDRAERAIRRTDRAGGLSGPDGAGALNALAVAYFQQGRFDDAIIAKSRAERLLGRGGAYPSIRAESALIEARTRAAQQEINPALRAFERALHLFRLVPGENSVRVAVTLQNKGLLLSEDGQFDAAEAALNEALTINSRVLGERHLLTGQVWFALAQNAAAQKDFTTAAARIDRWIKIERRLLDPENPTVADTLTLHGTILQGLGKIDEAAREQERAVAIYKSIYKRPHYDIGIALVYLALIEADRKKFEVALDKLAEAKHNYDESYGKLHANHGDLLVNRATILAKAGRRSEALSDCADGIDILVRTLGPDAGYTKQMRETCEQL